MKCIQNRARVSERKLSICNYFTFLVSYIDKYEIDMIYKYLQMLTWKLESVNGDTSQP